MNTKIWRLIPDETVSKIDDALTCAMEKQQEDCESTGCLCDMYPTPTCWSIYESSLYELHSFLNETDAIPNEQRAE